MQDCVYTTFYVEAGKFYDTHYGFRSQITAKYVGFPSNNFI